MLGLHLTRTTMAKSRTCAKQLNASGAAHSDPLSRRTNGVRVDAHAAERGEDAPPTCGGGGGEVVRVSAPGVDAACCCCNCDCGCCCCCGMNESRSTTPRERTNERTNPIGTTRQAHRPIGTLHHELDRAGTLCGRARLLLFGPFHCRPLLVLCNATMAYCRKRVLVGDSHGTYKARHSGELRASSTIGQERTT